MPQTDLEFRPGDRVRLTAAKDGNATDVSWRWVPPAGSSAPASTTNVLEWVTGANDAGVYDVEVTSLTASDSPGYGVIRLQLPLATDPDAIAYIAAVEAADGQALEAQIRAAIDAFVIGMKADGNWDGVTQLYPLLGARTPEGAGVALKGPPVTLSNVTSADYSRIKGHNGKGWSGFLNGSSNATMVGQTPDMQNSAHICAGMDNNAIAGMSLSMLTSSFNDRGGYNEIGADLVSGLCNGMNVDITVDTIPPGSRTPEQFLLVMNRNSSGGYSMHGNGLTITPNIARASQPLTPAMRPIDILLTGGTYFMGLGVALANPTAYSNRILAYYAALEAALVPG
jgi:hypothetical protein